MDNETEKKKIHLETLKQLIFARYNSILTSATLAAAILVIASFNSSIIPITPLVKSLIVILLLVIAVSLLDFTFKINRDLNYIVNRHFKEEISQIAQPKNGRLKSILEGSNYIYVSIIAITLFILVFLILRNF